MLPKIRTLAANHVEVIHDGIRTMYSYDTPIVSYINGAVHLYKDWAYSPTTSKHRSIYMNESTAVTKRKLRDGSILLCLIVIDICTALTM